MHRRISAPGARGGPGVRATAVATRLSAVATRLSAAVVAPPKLVATTAGPIYATAGVVGLLTPLFPQAAGVQALELQVLAAGALATGLALLRWGPRLPAWGAHVVVLAAVAAVSTAVVLAGPTPTGVALNGFFIFVALDCALFFTRAVGWLHMGVAVVACVGVLAAQSPSAIGAGVITAMTAVVVAHGTGSLVRMAAVANLDPLTGLANRRHLDEVLAAAAEHATRTRAPLSVALLDLDRFKTVNDTLGHAAGDQLLQDVARAWTPLLGSGHLLARQGGDEFVVVMPGVRRGEAVAVAERLRAAMPHGRTCSVGVAELWHGEAPRTLVRRADAALYRVKHSGRDGVADSPAPATSHA